MTTLKQIEKKTGIHYITNHTGKMEGMYSLSTSCTENDYCKRRCNDKDSICFHCYAQRQMKRYKNLENCLIKNTKILTSKILDKDELPVINALYFRLESFGDLNNEKQVINYFNLCNKNKNVKFALWTKNPWIIESVINYGIAKPKNLNIIYSTYKVNHEDDFVFESYPFVDKIFSVYDKEFVKKNNITINCGKKKCLLCGKCYKKSKDKIIREIIK